MAIKSSGSLSMQEINAEFGRGLNLNAYRNTGYYNSSDVLSTFSSGSISFSNFYNTKKVRSVPIILFLTNTAATTWTVPSDWNNSVSGPGGFANSVECIGGGGSGGDGGSDGAGGGGGGAYARKNNISLTPGSVVSIKVGAGGVPEEGDGQDTWFASTGTVLAKAGLNPPGTGTSNKTGGSGGQAGSCVGDLAYSGSQGRSQGASSSSGGGGGGAAGPDGPGGAGGGAISSTGTAAGPGSWTATNGAFAAPGAGANAGSTTGGFLYGGGGNGEGSSPAGRPGAQGIIVISYYPIALP